MRTLGIDVASQAARTAICSICWEDDSARIELLETCGATDLEIRRRIDGADRVGVDIRLGWPTAFVDAVSKHNQRRPWTAPVDGDGMRALRLRETDRWITATARRPSEPNARCHPMSVSTNLLAIPAMRMAALLGPFDRNGGERVTEVYSAGV